MATLAVPLDQYVELDRAAFGEDVVVDAPQRVAGTYSTPAVDITAWTIGITVGLTPNGPPDATLTALASVAKVGTNGIRFTLPAALSRTFTTERTLYIEVWRLDEGTVNRRPMRRYSQYFYDPVLTA